jgi:hypothetical protein
MVLKGKDLLLDKNMLALTRKKNDESYQRGERL